MKKITYFSIVTFLLFCLNGNYTQAQNTDADTARISGDELFLVGTWVADTLYNVNTKTGKRKPDLDFMWSKFKFSADKKGEILWNYHTNGGGSSYFTWHYFKNDSVLKIISMGHVIGYWKFLHFNDTCIDVVNYDNKYPDKSSPLPRTQEEKRYFKNEITSDDFYAKSINTVPVPVYATERLEVETAMKYFSTGYGLSVTLTDISGKAAKTLLNKKQVPANSLVVEELNFKDVPNGIYILSISDENTINKSLKIDIEK